MCTASAPISRLLVHTSCRTVPWHSFVVYVVSRALPTRLAGCRESQIRLSMHALLANRMSLVHCEHYQTVNRHADPARRRFTTLQDEETRSDQARARDRTSRRRCHMFLHLEASCMTGTHINARHLRCCEVVRDMSCGLACVYASAGLRASERPPRLPSDKTVNVVSTRCAS